MVVVVVMMMMMMMMTTTRDQFKLHRHQVMSLIHLNKCRQTMQPVSTMGCLPPNVIPEYITPQPRYPAMFPMMYPGSPPQAYPGYFSPHHGYTVNNYPMTFMPQDFFVPTQSFLSSPTGVSPHPLLLCLRQIQTIIPRLAQSVIPIQHNYLSRFSLFPPIQQRNLSSVWNFMWVSSFFLPKFSASSTLHLDRVGLESASAPSVQ